MHSWKPTRLGRPVSLGRRLLGRLPYHIRVELIRVWIHTHVNLEIYRGGKAMMNYYGSNNRSYMSKRTRPSIIPRSNYIRRCYGYFTTDPCRKAFLMVNECRQYLARIMDVPSSSPGPFDFLRWIPVCGLSTLRLSFDLHGDDGHSVRGSYRPFFENIARRVRVTTLDLMIDWPEDIKYPMSYFVRPFIGMTKLNMYIDVWGPTAADTGLYIDKLPRNLDSLSLSWRGIDGEDIGAFWVTTAPEAFEPARLRSLTIKGPESGSLFAKHVSSISRHLKKLTFEVYTSAYVVRPRFILEALRCPKKLVSLTFSGTLREIVGICSSLPNLLALKVDILCGPNVSECADVKIASLRKLSIVDCCFLEGKDETLVADVTSGLLCRVPSLRSLDLSNILNLCKTPQSLWRMFDKMCVMSLLRTMHISVPSTLNEEVKMNIFHRVSTLCPSLDYLNFRSWNRDKWNWTTTCMCAWGTHPVPNLNLIRVN